jgi:hypothetical protein
MTADGVRGPGSGPYAGRARADLPSWQPAPETATEHVDAPLVAADDADLSGAARELRDRLASARERAANAIGGEGTAIRALDAARRATGRLARQIGRRPAAAVAAQATGLDEQRVADLVA